MQLTEIITCIISFSAVISIVAGQACKSTWSSFKTKSEGPFYAGLPPNNSSFKVSRETEFRCINQLPSFRTFRFGDFSFDTYRHGIEIKQGFGECSGSCREKTVNVPITYNKVNDQWTDYGSTTKTVVFQYTNRNCDVLFWTSWVNKKACPIPLLSHQITFFTRRCVDCDSSPVNNQLCQGSERRIVNCKPSWSEGVAGSCASRSNRCNSTGERQRTRECHYGDGVKTSNLSLCQGNSVVQENCIVTSTCDHNNAFRCKNLTKMDVILIAVLIGLVLNFWS